MFPSQILKDFFLDNKDEITIDLVARVISEVYDKTEVKILIQRLDARL